ncbi:TGF-b1 [Deerpox virus W-848-83]|uniref:TGF-b1 n=1 Tax=Deerpox virus (strain Mule deer/United States/W-848-83/1983) TaxID=305674 RepID=Q08FI9_DPV83|nr:TGF-b1 [Deerpox virus W-848-83]ABI99318.1 TGF-b1 [Deerpox virus W-848-83]
MQELFNNRKKEISDLILNKLNLKNIPTLPQSDIFPSIDIINLYNESVNIFGDDKYEEIDYSTEFETLLPKTYKITEDGYSCIDFDMTNIRIETNRDSSRILKSLLILDFYELLIENQKILVFKRSSTTGNFLYSQDGLKDPATDKIIFNIYNFMSSSINHETNLLMFCFVLRVNKKSINERIQDMAKLNISNINNPHILLLKKKNNNIRTVRHVMDSCELSSTCCLVDFYIDFKKDMGWNWIYKPEGYHANLCIGNCNHKLINMPYNYAFKHNVFCCAPKKMKSLIIAYYEGRKYKVDNLKNMKIVSCGC